MRVVLAVGLFVGLGAVPLWALVPAPSFGLVLEAGRGVGAFLGLLEIFGRLLRLGAVAAQGLVLLWHRAYGLRPARQSHL